MSLVATYYDFVKNIRPHVVKNAELDAELVRKHNPDQLTVHSVDDYADSNLENCLEETKNIVCQKMADESGMPVEMIKSHIQQFPEALKAQLMTLYATINYEFHSVLNFELSGKKTFYFNDNLSDHLANTDINMKADDIEMPFASCQFVYTSESVINAMHNIRGKKGRKDMNTGGIDYKAPVSVFVTLHDSNDENLPGRKLVIVAFQARSPHKSYQILKRELYLGEGWTLEEALRTDWEELTPDSVQGGLSLSLNETEDVVNEDVSDEVFYTDGLHFYRIILNSILYLDSDNAELIPERSTRSAVEDKAKGIASVPKRRKRLKEAANTSYLDYLDVGRSVQPIVIDKSRDSAGGGDSSGTNKSFARFIVRGHWKQQVHGPKFSLRKRIRIAPYYKGPEMADLVNKPYVVK